MNIDRQSKEKKGKGEHEEREVGKAIEQQGSLLWHTHGTTSIIRHVSFFLLCLLHAPAKKEDFIIDPYTNALLSFLHTRPVFHVSTLFLCCYCSLCFLICECIDQWALSTLKNITCICLCMDTTCKETSCMSPFHRHPSLLLPSLSLSLGH